MTDLIETSNLAYAIDARDAALAKYKEADQLLAEAAELLEKAAEAFGPDGRSISICHRDHIGGYPVSLQIDKIERYVDRTLWLNTLANSGLTNIMSQGEYNKAVDSLEKQVPEFSLENVRASYIDLAGRMDEIEVSGIIELFRELSWDYKSNLPVRFGTRIVFKNMLDGGYFCHKRAHVLGDFEKAIHRADGKSPPAGRETLYHRAHDALHKENRSEYADAYFRVKWFKNGNLHLWPLRLDLVDVLNKQIADQYPNTLPPAR